LDFGMRDLKTTVLVENIADIKWETTESEIEALVLESLLIKKFKPKFNIKTKDDKDFLWVKIDMKQDFPYPELVRRPNVETRRGVSLQKIKFFGPFTDPKLLKEGLNILRKIFLWRDCFSSKFSFYSKKGKPCLEYYIKNCNAPCTKLVNANDYQLGIKQLVMFLQGGKKKIIKDFERKMKTFSKNKEFEKAAVYRDKLRSLQHLGVSLNLARKNKDIRYSILDIGDDENIQYSISNIQPIRNIIKFLNRELGYKLRYKPDFRIEFYDISNISGSNSVGSMIVWQGNHFNKGQYRKFKIKFVKGPNDVGMMGEVLKRRLQKIFNFQFSISNQFSITNDQKDKSFSQKPDLIAIDGGKPQLSEIWKLFQQLNIDIPLVSLAKREEEVFGVKDGKFKKTNIRKNSPEGFFIQRLRDEAHRFAIGYHKVLRSKKVISSKLDNIEGIGPKFKKKLLLKFGSVGGIIKANISEVTEVVGKKLANKIKENL